MLAPPKASFTQSMIPRVDVAEMIERLREDNQDKVDRIYCDGVSYAELCDLEQNKSGRSLRITLKGV